MDITKELEQLKNGEFYEHLGLIDKVVGMSIEAHGLSCSIGDICEIHTMDKQSKIMAEVVGFKENRIILMPYEDISGIGYGSYVVKTGKQLEIAISKDMIGKVIDPLGRCIDGSEILGEKQVRGIQVKASNPLSRPRIQEVIPMGVRAIDGLLTLGKGQRLGIFAGSGVGKSTLMGMIARNVKADINVIALVGERGREVLEFIEKDLGEEGIKRSILVVATSDQSAMMRNKCPQTATAIAEYFRDLGYDVLLMMDSLTRYAMSLREIGLNIGEVPVARGYTNSIYSELPKLLERSGNFNKGSITGIYTVLVEGDDMNEPISDTVRGILDGHIILSRKIAARNHYPAIDILGSVSRLMNDIVPKKHLGAAQKMRNLMALHAENEDLISIGAYKVGNNPKLDEALRKIDKINEFLVQEVSEKADCDKTLDWLERCVS